MEWGSKQATAALATSRTGPSRCPSRCTVTTSPRVAQTQTSSGLGQFKERFECKIQVLGPGRNQQREVRVLNTVVKWSKHGIYYEADQRHSEIVVCEMGLENAQPAPTAGTREEKRRRASLQSSKGGSGRKVA